MLGESVVTGEEGQTNKMPQKSMIDLKDPVSTTLSSPPPAKKLKQARLSFKVLEPKPIVEIQVSPTTTTPISKKRKHSDSTSNTPKSAAKLQKSDDGGKVKQRAGRQDDAENEVSSSSEADCISKVSSPDQKTGKPRGLERFVQSTQQLEVSTSSEVVDLTGDKVPEKKEVKKASPTAKDEKKKGCKRSPPKTTTQSVKNMQKENQPENSTAEESKVEKTEDEKSKDSVPVDCDNSVLDSTVESMNESMETSDQDKSISVSDEDSDKKDSSVCSTAPSTPSTPGSRAAKGRPPLSATKTKQKEEDRLRKLKEKEKQKVEKQQQKELEKQKKEEARKEKEKQKEEQRLEKERKKKEEQEKREQERLQKEKEKEEKLAEKEREKEEKLKQKEEEKKKKQEAIEAKLEEKKRKDEEKEAEKKKKEEEKGKAVGNKNRNIQKSQSMFKQFFVKVEQSEPTKTADHVGPFPAFNVLPNMRMAPSVRQSLPDIRRTELDQHMENQSATELYTKQMKSGDYVRGVSGQTWPVEDDVTIDEPSPDHSQQLKLRKKMLKFHENYRPAYYGTWRKKSKTVNPRKPFAKDEEFLDYEVDSDDEWEEEEPGESLSDSEGEGEDGEEPVEGDEDDGFFVPHGYLSEGEGGEESDEEDGNPEKMKMRQIIKAKNFEAELMKKTEALQKLVVGVLWSHTNTKPDPCLAQYSATFLVDESPIMIQQTTELSMKLSKKKKCQEKQAKAQKEGRGVKPMHVPDEAMADLIKLVHGNMASLKKLIREFRVFWRRTQQAKEKTADTSTANPTEISMEISDDSGEKTIGSGDQNNSPSVDGAKNERLPESGESKSQDVDDEDSNHPNMISKRQLDLKIRAVAVYEKRKDHNRKCWYVNKDVLDKHELSALPVPTEWKWITPGPVVKAPKEVPDNTSTPISKKPGKDTLAHSTPNNHSIKQFAVPGLVHTYEAAEVPKASPVTPSPTVASNAAKKAAKRITPITLFCAKKPCTETVLQPVNITSTVPVVGKPLLSTVPVAVDKSTFPSKGKASASTIPVAAGKPRSQSPLVANTSMGGDDDCMIIDEPFVPPPPSKSQPTLLTMFPAKNSA